MTDPYTYDLTTTFSESLLVEQLAHQNTHVGQVDIERTAEQESIWHSFLPLYVNLPISCRATGPCSFSHHVRYNDTRETIVLLCKQWPLSSFSEAQA